MGVRNGDFYLPREGDFSADGVRAWFANIATELRTAVFTAEDRAKLEAYYTEAGLLRAWRRPFFWRHYAETLAAAAVFVFGARRHPVLLDLGCGTGTQSLFFALHGARVIAVDLDPAALRIFQRRKALYEERCGSVLPIEIVAGSAFDIDYRGRAPIDAVYSLFAFNMIQPSGRLLDVLLPHLGPGARWAVLDGNRVSVWTRSAPWRRRAVWSPAELRSALEVRGFRVETQCGGVALPPLVWSVLPYAVAVAIDTRLCSGTFWPVSHQTLAIKS